MDYHEKKKKAYCAARVRLERLLFWSKDLKIVLEYLDEIELENYETSFGEDL